MKPTTGQGINAGAMREQVQLQQRATQQDAAGEPQLTWNVFATVRAEVVRTTGREIYGAAERNSRVPTMWKLRYFDGALSQMRLVDLKTTRVYDIISAIDPTGRREELLVASMEIVEATP
jgi:head-tail adaptor